MRPSLQVSLPCQISTNPLFFQRRSLGRKITRKVFHPLKLPPLFEFSLIFIQSSQLFSELLLQTNHLNSTLDFSSENFMRLILFSAKVFSPGWLLDFTRRPELSIAIVGVMMILCLIKLGLMAYGVAYATKRVSHNKTLIVLFNWELKTLVPTTFFMAVSIFSRMILLAWEDNIKITGLNNLVCMLGFGFLVILRSGIVIGLLKFLNYLLPNRSLLATNSESVDLIIVFHQLALLILQLLPNNLWIVTLTSLLFSLLSLYFHFTRLVNQNIKSLYFKGYLLALVALLNFLLLIRTIVISMISEAMFGMDTTIIVFGILSPVVIQLVKSYLNGALLEILTKLNETSSYKMLYRISIINHLFKSKRQNDLACLLYATTEKIFETFEDKKTDSKSQKNQMITRYLEVLCTKFPKNDLIKLQTAYYHGRKLKNFEQAVKLIAKIDNTHNQNISVSACLLKRDLERMINKESTNSQQIDLTGYLDSKMAFSKLQVSVMKQVDLQAKIYQEYLKDHADMSLIENMSRQTFSQRKRMNKYVSLFLMNMPEGYLDVYYFLQGYYLIVQHSLSDSNKYTKLLQQKTLKLHKNLTSLHVNPDNLYDPKNAFLVISGQKESIGQIHYCSKAVLEMLGWDPQNLIGKNLSTIIPPIMHEICSDLIINPGERTDGVYQAFIRHKEGFIIEADLCFAIHPLMHRGFFFDVVIKSVFRKKKDFLILNENGEIEGFTENIGDKLGLKKGNIKIEQISKRLSKMNESFSFSRNNPAGDNNFLKTEECIFLYPLFENISTSSREAYYCQIEEWTYPHQGLLRVCVLEEDLTKKDHDGGMSLQKLTSFPKKGKTLSSDDPENFHTISEKQIGEEMNMRQQEVLIAISSHNNHLLSSQRNLLEGPELIKNRRNSKKRLHPKEILNEQTPSLRSRSSQKSHYWRISKAYQAALKSKYYPKSIIYVTRFILVLFLSVIALQIDFQIKMDKNFAQIEGKKDIIETAQSRNHFLLRLQDVARFETEILPILVLRQDFFFDAFIHPIITLGSSTLSETNKKLLQAASFLSHNEDRIRLFQKNVKIYGDDDAENGLILTNFQAADRMIQAIARGIYQINAKEFSQAIASFKFIAKNCLRDLLLTGEETVRIFVNSLKMFINDIETFLSTRYYICLELLFVIFVIGALLLRVQYNRIKDNMTVFSSLDLENVKELLDNLVEFRQSMENENYLEELQSKDLNQRQSTLILDPGKSRAKRTFRDINHQNLTKKYFLYGMKLGILVGLLIGLLSKSKFLLKHRIIEIEKKVAQVHYSSWILSQTYLCYASLIELFSEEKLVMIRNQLPYDQAVESMKQVQGVIHEIAKGYFADHDSRYDTEVFKLLFENVCSKDRAESDSLYFCELPQNEGKTVNFLNLISNIEYQTNQVLRDYSTSDQTIENLNKFIDQIVNFIFPSISAQEHLNRQLSSRLSFLFEESMHISIEQNTRIGVYIGFGIVLTAGLVWLLIFRRIREADNEFKEMLSVFPVSLILQNFKLKNYLKETAASESFGIFTNRE